MDQTPLIHSRIVFWKNQLGNLLMGFVFLHLILACVLSFVESSAIMLILENDESYALRLSIIEHFIGALSLRKSKSAKKIIN